MSLLISSIIHQPTSNIILVSSSPINPSPIKKKNKTKNKTLLSIPHQKKPLHPPSVSVLYPVVNKEVEQQFSSRGVTV
jgi:hypothetical protein